MSMSVWATIHADHLVQEPTLGLREVGHYRGHGLRLYHVFGGTVRLANNPEKAERVGEDHSFRRV